MAAPVINSNFTLNILQQRELDDAFYSSLDSDEEKEENEKKSIIPRTNQKVLRSTTIKQKDVFTEEKRKRLLEKMGELRRFHQLKDREIQNTKVSWSLLYNLLFCDYFNMLKKKKLFAKTEKNMSDNQEILFNIKEVELRIKKLLDKMNNKKTFMDLDPKKTKQKISLSLPTAKWLDTPLSTILKPNSISPSESGNFLPSYITAFNSFLEKEMTSKPKNNSPLAGCLLSSGKFQSTSQIKQKPNGMLMMAKRQSYSNVGVFMSNHFPIIKKTEIAEPKTPFVRSHVNHKSTKSIKEFTIPQYQGENNMLSSNSKPQNEIEGNNMIQGGNSGSIKEKNNFAHKYKDILNNGKNLKKLIKKYPQYENDILNIKNNFMTYDIELNKDENLFFDPLNNMNRHYLDFHYDSEAQKNAKMNKKHQVKDKILFHAKKIDTFINDFNELMDNDEIRKEYCNYEM